MLEILNTYKLNCSVGEPEDLKNRIACISSWFLTSVCFLSYHASYCVRLPFINDSGLDEQTMVPSAAAPGLTVANTFGVQSNVLCQVSELPDPGSSNRWLKSSSPWGATVSCLHLLHCLCRWNLLPRPAHQLCHHWDLRQLLPGSTWCTDFCRCNLEDKRRICYSRGLGFPSEWF